MVDTRDARDQIPDEDRVIGVDGLVAPRPGYRPSVEIARQVDRVEATRPVSGVPRYNGGLLTHLPERDLDALTVACIGISREIQAMRYQVIDLMARLENDDDLQVRTCKVEKVVFEYPRQEDEAKVPMALIEQASEVVYDSNGTTPYLLEETADVYYPGTVLRSIASASVELLITIVLAHKDERRAVRTMFESLLLAEPDSEKHGRRIVVPENFDRSVRYQLLGSPVPPTDGAQGNRWFYQARVLAEVERVQLVGSPETIKALRSDVSI